MAEKRNLTIDQGATYRLEFGWRADSTITPGTPSDVPIPLTGATVRMQVRKAQGSPILIEATSNDDITVDGPAGDVVVVLPPSKTTLLAYKSCRYDLEADFGVDDVHRLLEGSITVKPNITQEPGDPIVQR